MINVISRFIDDKNISSEMCESLLESFAQIIDEHMVDSRFYEQKLVHDFNLKYLFPVGPRVIGLPNKVRVSRLLTLQTFLRYFISDSSTRFLFGNRSISDPSNQHIFQNIDRASFNSLFENHMDSLLFKDVVTQGRYSVWTTLYNEVVFDDLDELQNQLGIYHFLTSTPLVLITYTIDSSELYVPTILDAHFNPSFVSKSTPDNGLPKAWDWSKSQWGLPEMVHRPRVDVEHVDVRFLGLTSGLAQPNLTRLTCCKTLDSIELKEFVLQTLHQVSAHHKLQPFLNGSTDVIELDPYEFENFLALLYNRQGYNASVTKASRDGGFDVIAISNKSKRDSLLIQAKHTKNTVGIRVIRELFGARILGDEKLRSYMLVVATTSHFSPVAKNVEEMFPSDLSLLDYSRIMKQLESFRNTEIRDIVRENLSEFYS